MITLVTLFSFLCFAFFIALVVIWIFSIYHASISETDEMKQNRPLWIILILFAGIIGSIVYYFVDAQKNRAITAILSLVGLLVSLVGFVVFGILALDLSGSY